MSYFKAPNLTPNFVHSYINLHTHTHSSAPSHKTTTTDPDYSCSLGLNIRDRVIWPTRFLKHRGWAVCFADVLKYMYIFSDFCQTNFLYIYRPISTKFDLQVW